jgi:hypothetical protein
VSPDPADREPDPEPGAGQETDAAWKAIVENYGDRAELPDEPTPAPPPAPRAPEGHAYDDADEPVEWDADEEGYVPPPAPPVPHPTGLRALAWAGLFGSPVIVLLSIVFQVAVPAWGALLLLLAFVGGFTYLVATMRKDAGDGWDDGAVL